MNKNEKVNNIFSFTKKQNDICIKRHLSIRYTGNEDEDEEPKLKWLPAFD
jgi:hypothetical protein